MEETKATKKAKSQDFYDRLASWMRENDCGNPREVPDGVVEALRSGDA